MEWVYFRIGLLRRRCQDQRQFRPGAVEGSDLVPLVHRENQRPIARRKLDLHTGPYQDRVTLAVPTG